MDNYLKPTVLFYLPLSTHSLCLLWDLSSLLHFRSRGISRPQALCAGFVPKLKKRFSDRRQHKRKCMLPIVLQSIGQIDLFRIYLYSIALCIQKSLRNNNRKCRGCPRGVIVKAMDCGIVVREFILQSRYYVHFRANTLGKGMNPFILPAMG